MKSVKDKLLSWQHSAAGHVSIALIIASVLLFLLACSEIGVGFMTERAAEIANSVLIGLATNLIGIVITVSFVQYFIDKQNEAEERAEEVKIIKRYDKYMQTLIRRYLMFYMSVTTRLKDRNSANLEKPYDHKFKFSDMADMYLTSMLISEGVIEPSIVLFYKAEENLREYMLRMLENIDFKYNPAIEELLLSFTTKSVDHDMRGQILGAIKTRMGESGKATEKIAKWIVDENHDWLGKFSRGELQGNLMLPYVILYYTMQDQIRMIKEYTEYIKKITL